MFVEKYLESVDIDFLQRFQCTDFDTSLGYGIIGKGRISGIAMEIYNAIYKGTECA
jgi:hypothetical protein